MVNNAIVTAQDVLSANTHIAIDKLEVDTKIIVALPAGDDVVSAAATVIGVDANDVATVIGVASNQGFDVILVSQDFDEYVEVYISTTVVAAAGVVTVPISNIRDCVTIRTSPIFFNRSELLQWISAPQLEQIESMNPKAIEQAYASAIGLINAQLGNYYDISKLLAEADPSKKDLTILWVLEVVTVFNVCSPVMKVSDPIQFNFEQALASIKELKGGQQSLVDAELNENNTAGTIVSRKKYYRG